MSQTDYVGEDFGLLDDDEGCEIGADTYDGGGNDVVDGGLQAQLRLLQDEMDEV